MVGDCYDRTDKVTSASSETIRHVPDSQGISKFSVTILHDLLCEGLRINFRRRDLMERGDLTRGSLAGAYLGSLHPGSAQLSGLLGSLSYSTVIGTKS